MILNSNERVLTLDYESRDPYIGLKLGGGWVFGCNLKESLFKVLGAAVRTHYGQIQYIDLTSQSGIETLKDLVNNHDSILAHEATYELGILKYLKIDTGNKRIYDTKLLYKLFNNRLNNYSLDGLAKKFLKEDKGHKLLIDAVWNNGLYPWKASELKAKVKANIVGLNYERARPTDKKLLDWAYSNMDLVQEADFKAMSEYACLDVEQTWKLFKNVIEFIPEDLVNDYSKVTRILVDYRLRGVRIDLTKIRQLITEITLKIEQGLQEIYTLAGEEFNLRSTKDMPRIFDKLKIRYPLNERGNPSITTPWMKTQDNELCTKIVEVRKNLKLKGDFLEKFLEMQQYTSPGSTDYGILYPELHALQADTGRYSSTCVPMDSQALTRTGWKNYEQLIIGEDILAYDMDTQTKQWTPLLNKRQLKNQVVGELGTDFWLLRCTKDHTWISTKHKHKLKRADEFTYNETILTNANYLTDNQGHTIDLSTYGKYTTDMIPSITSMSIQELTAFVYGFLLADGHHSKPTKLGTYRGWQFTQAEGKILEELLIASYLLHNGRIGHHIHKLSNRPTHRTSTRTIFCNSANLTIRNLWAPKTIEDVWCPTTKYGTWVMRQGNSITITGNCPNIQQIPPEVREIFVPFEGESLYGLDFAAQEPRLVMHYCKKLGCEGIDEVVERYKQNPKFDYHKFSASRLTGKAEDTLTKADIKPIKAITLGLLYGIGAEKMGAGLGLNKEQAQELKDQYFDQFPYIKQFITYCRETLKSKKYIKTIGGRISRISPPMMFKDEKTGKEKEQLFEYLASSMVIQGSASDQITKCMILAWEAGLPVLFPVHDELVLSGNDEQAEKLKEIMENAIPMEVPAYVEIKKGMNWAQCK